VAALSAATRGVRAVLEDTGEHKPAARTPTFLISKRLQLGRAEHSRSSTHHPPGFCWVEPLIGAPAAFVPAVARPCSLNPTYAEL